MTDVLRCSHWRPERSLSRSIGADRTLLVGPGLVLFRSSVLPPPEDRMSRSTVVLAALVAALPATAQQRTAPRAASAPMMASVDTTLLKGLQYRMVGPNRGGRVTTVTGVPSQ